MPWQKVMDKFKSGSLHSGGPNGPKVTDPKQAVAIKMSEQAKAKAGKSYDNGGVVPKTGTIHVQKGELVVPANHPAFKQILNLFESADTQNPQDQQNPNDAQPGQAPAARPMAPMMARPAPPSSIAGGGM